MVMSNGSLFTADHRVSKVEYSAKINRNPPTLKLRRRGSRGGDQCLYNVFFGSEMEVIVGRAMLDEGFARRSFSEGGQPAFAKASAGETKKPC